MSFKGLRDLDKWRTKEKVLSIKKRLQEIKISEKNRKIKSRELTKDLRNAPGPSVNQSTVNNVFNYS